jgi:hypothetical protein
MFLDSIREKQAEEERLRKAQDGEELSDFRKYASTHYPSVTHIEDLQRAVAARENDLNKPTQPMAQPRKQSDDTPEKPKVPVVALKKDAKKTLKGVVVKKRPKSNAPTPSELKAKETNKNIDEDAPPVTKRRKMSGS